MVRDEMTQAVRSAIEDRAMYLYLLFKEMQAAFGNEKAEAVARRAIFRYGQVKGRAGGPMRLPEDFVEHQMRPGRQEIFEKEVAERSSERCEIRFRYCPLVEAWKRLGATDQELAQLCDIAMEGDHGMLSDTPLELLVPATLAKGDPCCRLVVQLRK